jgi:ADP-ribose pyrophosphatase YjhB (NUDIX family)
MSNLITVSQKAFIVSPHWQVLLIKHPLSEPGHTLWDLPGDGLQYAQSLRENLVKNVADETGYNLTTVSIPLNVTTFLDLANRSNQIVRIIYLCLAQGNPRQNKEMVWIDPAQHSHYAFPDEGYAKAFINYLSHSKLASEEFLGQGILEHTTEYLRQKPPLPFNPGNPLD